MQSLLNSSFLSNPWAQVLVTATIFGVAFLAAGHAVLTKRDSRAGFGWLAVCLFFPLFGPALYFLFGINRIQNRARKFQQRSRKRLDSLQEQSKPSTAPSAQSAESAQSEEEETDLVDEEQVQEALDTLPPRDTEIGRIGAAVGRWPLSLGNRVELLHNGGELYPRMLEAIANARETLYLGTYIFDTDETGREFIEALAAAHERGVEVRVLVDGVGQIYNIPWASSMLRSRGISVERFIPPRLVPPALHFNLRNHRKIMVVDGKVGFTGGMNISRRHIVRPAEGKDKAEGVIDLHAQLRGPIVCHLEQVFLEDWAFCTGNTSEPRDPSANQEGGQSYCRVITDGPDQDIDKLLVVLTSVISAAHRRVWVMTPYFLPPRTLIGALQAAALRGVEVKLLLPEKSDAPFVDWASRKHIEEVLERGVRVFYRPGLFAHSKILLIDDSYVQIGSANLDPRSLRLNFELAVEIFDEALAETVGTHCEEVAEECREISIDEFTGRSLPIRLRDSLAHLFSPYL